MPRTSSKCREWEKERRDRLKNGFTALKKVLPCYDPAANLSQTEILEKAAAYIEELRSKGLVPSDSSNKPDREEIKKLYERIKKLLTRNEQLSNLLRDAGIAVPNECGRYRRFRRSPQWSNKFSLEQAKKLANTDQKENVAKKPKQKKKKPKPKLNKTVLIFPKQKFVKKSSKKGLKQNAVVSKTLINPQCFIITKAPSNCFSHNSGSTTVVTHSTLLASPIVASTIKPTVTTSLTKLGPGTLIFANGNIVPVINQPPAIIPAPILLKPHVNKTTLIVVTSTTGSLVKPVQVPPKSTVSGGLVPIKPKKFCVTRTTQINKVPIPSLRSSFANDCSTKNIVKTNAVKAKELTKKVGKDNKENKKNDGNKKDNVIKRKATDEVDKEDNKRLKVAEEVNKVLNDKDSSQKFSIDSICKNKVADEEVQKEIASNAEVVEETQIEQEKIEKPIDVKEAEESVKELIVEEVPTTKNNPIEVPENVLKEVEVAKEIEAEKPSEESKTKDIELNLSQSELSNDIFASLQVPTGGQNPESTSPTAAFLLAFPLVSSLTGVKVTEVIEEDNSDSQRGTPTLLQIGTMDTTKPTQSNPESFTPNLLNLDNFSFFGKDGCNNFYPSFDNFVSSLNSTLPVSTVTSTVANKNAVKFTESQKKDFTTNCKETNVTFGFTKENSNVPTSFGKESYLQTYPPKTASYVPQEKAIIAEKPIDACVTYSASVYDSTFAKTKPNLPLQKSSIKPIPQCNTFNPFTDITKSVSVCGYNTITKSYPEPLYTNSSNYTYNCNSDSSFNSPNYVPSKNNNKTYYGVNYENSYMDYKTGAQFTNNYYQAQNPKDKFVNQRPKSKIDVAQPRPPVNWMTTPDLRQQAPATDYLLPSFGKESDFSYPSNSFVQTTYTMHTTSDLTNTFADVRKTMDSFPVLPTNDDNQFTWSPTKLPQLLDAQHTFVPSTLPTLVGDLALGTSTDVKAVKDVFRPKDNRRVKTQNYDNQANFLSVSQLVDHYKTDGVPARTTTRRNSGNRSKSNSVSKTNKRNQKDIKEIHVNHNKQAEKIMKKPQSNYNDWINETTKTNHIPKNSSSSYSAEALIGHNQSSVQRTNQNQNYSGTTKTLPVPFLTDNIIPYFPPVDLQQDNTFTQQNQNYQNTSGFSHNFPSSIQNNTYPTNTFIPSGQSITSNYLPSSNFIPDLTTHDYNPMLSDNLNIFSHTSNKTIDNKYSKPPTIKPNNTPKNPSCSMNSTNNFPKKSKRKHSSESNVPGFVDFSFLSMPGTINSPILPDDFHTNFLPPPTPQLYPCKNTLYPKQPPDLNSSSILTLPPVPASRSNIQHPEISPSINNVSTSLTNFNLSTIFPEINKGSAPLPDLYSDQGRIKDVHKNYVTSMQVPFCNKSTFTTTYSTVHSFTNP